MQENYISKLLYMHIIFNSFIYKMKERNSDSYM